MAKVLNFLLVLLLLTSCDNNLSSPLERDDNFLSSVKNTDDLKIELKIESKQIENLGDIKAQFKLQNISGKEITYGFPSGCQYGYTVTKNKKTSLIVEKTFYVLPL